LEAGNAVKSGRGLAVARIADSGCGLAVARKVTSETAPPITGRATVDFSASFLERIQADARNESRVLKAVGKNKGDVSFVVRRATALTALQNRAKRLRGEHIPDGEYQAMMDYMAHYNDPYYILTRGSPDVKGSRIKG
jgi:hypothetical protein